MSDEIIVKHCSPTLAGMKTGNMINVEYDSREQTLEDLRRLNKTMVPRGLRAVPLRFSENKALIYIFRPDMLQSDLSREEACQVLSSCGYKCDGCNNAVVRLISRVKDQGSFPHEVGLFLGYPIDDVIGFIDNKGSNFKCSGHWKVYSDMEDCRKTFESYRKCTVEYLTRFSQGEPIEQLLT